MCFNLCKGFIWTETLTDFYRLPGYYDCKSASAKFSDYEKLYFYRNHLIFFTFLS